MNDIHRYLFTVRQRFGETPTVDSFYKVRVPPGIDAEQAKIMNTLSNDNFFKEEVRSDGNVMQGLMMRLRMNSDMYQHVCMVSTEFEIEANDLDLIVASKYNDGSMGEFLKDAEIG